jgi:hypothetical protein
VQQTLKGTGEVQDALDESIKSLLAALAAVCKLIVALHADNCQVEREREREREREIEREREREREKD